MIIKTNKKNDTWSSDVGWLGGDISSALNEISKYVDYYYCY